MSNIQRPHRRIQFRLTEQLNVEPDSPHEQVDVAQALPVHVLWQTLADSDCLHDALLDTDDEALLLIRRSTNAHGGEELPDVDIVCGSDAGVGGEDVGQQGLDGVEKARVEVRPLANVLLLLAGGLRRGSEGLLDELGAGNEHGEDGDAGLGADGGEDVHAVQDEAEEADDDVKRCFVDIAEERRHDGLGEEFDLLLDARRNGGVVLRRVGVAYDVENIEVDDDKGKHGKTLLFIEMAEDTRDCFLALAVREDLNEWVRRAVAASC